jgi:hypothetical protein
MKNVCFSVVAWLLSSTLVSATTLVGAVGPVSVNKGEGFVPVTGEIELVPGDRVLVGEGGFAAINYVDCALTLDKPSLHAVTKTPTCDAISIMPTADVPDMDPAAPVGAAFPWWPALLTVGTATVFFATDGFGILDEEDDPQSGNGQPPVGN